MWQDDLESCFFVHANFDNVFEFSKGGSYVPHVSNLFQTMNYSWTGIYAVGQSTYPLNSDLGPSLRDS